MTKKEHTLDLKIDLLPQEKSAWPMDPALILLPLAGLISALVLLI